MSELRHRLNRRGALETFALYEFDAEDCRAVAACMPIGDKWADELLADADELDRLNGVTDA